MKSDTQLLVQTARPQLQEPRMYQVIMFNDDFTPMEFVVTVLETFFSMDRAKATEIMYQVHMAGKAVCGIYSRDIAETKVDQVSNFARTHEYPLLCNSEAL